MNKKNMQKKHKGGTADNSRPSAVKALSSWDEEEYDDNDFGAEDDDAMCNMMDSFNQDAMSDFMISMIEAANHQMTLTNELTKIVVGKSTKEMNADEVFAIFKKAAVVIAETSPLKDLMEKLPTK
jgi:hypothetical protein